jgi:hypothetical protein
VEAAATSLTQAETLSRDISHVAVTTLTREPSSVSTGITSSEMPGTDLLPMNSSPLLLSDFVDYFDSEMPGTDLPLLLSDFVECFDISNMVEMT